MGIKVDPKDAFNKKMTAAQRLQKMGIIQNQNQSHMNDFSHGDTSVYRDNDHN